MSKRLLVPGAALAVSAGMVLSNTLPPASAATGPTNTLVKARNATVITYDPNSNAVFDPVGLLGIKPMSFSAVALIAAGATAGGTLRISDLDYQWPNTTSGQPDAVALRGQTITVAVPAGATELGVLAASHGAAVTASMVFHYLSCNRKTKKSVATTENHVLTIPDWWQVGQAPANSKTARFLMAKNAVPVPVPNGFYEVRTPLDPSKRLVSITLPVANSVLFDLQARKPSSPPKPVKGCKS